MVNVEKHLMTCLDEPYTILAKWTKECVGPYKSRGHGSLRIACKRT